MEEMFSTRVHLKQHSSHKIVLLTIIKEDEQTMNTIGFAHCNTQRHEWREDFFKALEKKTKIYGGLL